MTFYLLTRDSAPEGEDEPETRALVVRASTTDEARRLAAKRTGHDAFKHIDQTHCRELTTEGAAGVLLMSPAPGQA